MLSQVLLEKILRYEIFAAMGTSVGGSEVFGLGVDSRHMILHILLPHESLLTHLAPESSLLIHLLAVANHLFYCGKFVLLSAFVTKMCASEPFIWLGLLCVGDDPQNLLSVFYISDKLFLRYYWLNSGLMIRISVYKE